MISREETQSKLDLLSAGALRHTPEQDYTVADRFEARAAETPQRAFLIWNGQPISYDEANRQANRYAHFAYAQGLRQGDVAALMMENRPEFLFIWMGLAKIGCVAALINTHVSGGALDHAINAATHSQLLFVGDECLGCFEGSDWSRPTTFIVPQTASNGVDLEGAVLLDQQLLSQSDDNPERSYRDQLVGESLLSLVFTSGTTGLPKAAKVSHMRWLGTGEGWTNMFSFNQDDVFYCVLPLYHVAAGMSLFSQTLASGGTMVLRPRFSASRFWDEVRNYGVTVTQYSGEMCRYLLNQPPADNDRDHRLRVMSGAGLSPECWLSFQQRFGVEKMIEGYGGTEVNCNLVNVDNKVGSVGRIPFKDRSNARLVKYDVANNAYVRDADGFLLECEAGEVGELLGMIVNIPGVGIGRFEGYTDADATEKKILHNVFEQGDTWFSSGDLFKRDEDDYFYFVDRTGDTFRWKSENVSTLEVANALGSYPGMELITVYGVAVPDNEGRAGMAAVLMQADEAFRPQAFYKLATAKLPSYAVPLFIRVVQQADITVTFKLRKVDLQKEGYSTKASKDDFYVLDVANSTYSPLTNETLARLNIAPCQS